MPKSIKLQNKDDIKKKKEFRQWLDPYSTGKYKGYDTFLLREKLCVVVKNVTNEDNIYRISDPKTVDKIKKIYIQQYSDENKNSIDNLFLFGHSMGGTVITRFMQIYQPKNLKLVVLSAPMFEIKLKPNQMQAKISVMQTKDSGEKYFPKQ